MATLASTPRKQTITLASASAGPFDLEFRLFAHETLVVFVSGVESTDFTVSSSFVGTFDDNATITFGTALAIADVIAIEPVATIERQDNILPGANLIEKMDGEEAAQWVALADLQQQSNRAIKVIPGATEGLFAPLPEVGKLLKGRADGLGWDSGSTEDEIITAAASAALSSDTPLKFYDTTDQFLAAATALSALPEETFVQVGDEHQKKKASAVDGQGGSILGGWLPPSGIVTPETLGFDDAKTVSYNTGAIKEAFQSGSEVRLRKGQRYIIDQIDLDGIDDLHVFGGGELKLNYGTNDAIVKMTNCKRPVFNGIKLTGTSDEDAGAYDSANQHAGLWFSNGCEFPQARHCDFTKFSSFGIRANNLSGGINTRGLFVFDGKFFDFGSANASFWPTAILLQEDAEYSTIAFSDFYNVPAALSNRSASGTAGNANWSFIENDVQKCTNYDSVAGGIQLNRACIYSDPPVAQSGKARIQSCRINHNDSGIIPILLNGVAGLPLNTVKITETDLLVNGTSEIAYQIYLINNHSATVSGTTMRPKSTTAAQGALKLVGCPGAVVDENKFQNVHHGIEADDVYLTGGTNVFEGSLVGSRSSSRKPVTNRRVTTRFIGATGDLDGGYDSSTDFFTSNKTGTGVYVLTLGTSTVNYVTGGEAQYFVEIEPEDFVLVKHSITTTTITIEFQNAAGTAVDANARVSVTGILRP